MLQKYYKKAMIRHELLSSITLSKISHNKITNDNETDMKIRPKNYGELGYNHN